MRNNRINTIHNSLNLIRLVANRFIHRPPTIIDIAQWAFVSIYNHLLAISSLCRCIENQTKYVTLNFKLKKFKSQIAQSILSGADQFSFQNIFTSNISFFNCTNTILISFSFFCDLFFHFFFCISCSISLCVVWWLLLRTSKIDEKNPIQFPIVNLRFFGFHE